MSVGAGQIENLIRVAHEYPRSLDKFMKNAIAMACANDEVAASCFYAKPQAGGTVTGPSVRLAEIIASTYKNLWVQSTPIDEDKRFIVVRGTAWDLESNVCVSYDTKRQITNKHGQTYADHAIATAYSAAASVAMRNAIFRVVPSAITQPIVQRIRSTIRGDEGTLDERRAKMVQWFAAQGVDTARICTNLEVDSIINIGLDEFELLMGVTQSIREGVPVDELFPRSSTGEDLSPRQALVIKSQTASESLRERINGMDTEGGRETIDADPGLPGNPVRPEPERDPDTNQIIPDYIGVGK